MTTDTMSTGRRISYRFNKIGLMSLGIILAWALVAILAPLLAPYPVGKIVNFEFYAPMSAKFWMGTDYLGRDMLSRVLMGARYTVGISLVAVALACFMGVALGMMAAVLGGWIDTVLSRLMDALISIPSKLFGLVVVAGLGSSIPV